MGSFQCGILGYPRRWDEGRGQRVRRERLRRHFEAKVTVAATAALLPLLLLLALRLLVAPEEDAGNVLVGLEPLDEPRKHFLFVDDPDCEFSNKAARDLKRRSKTMFPRLRERIGVNSAAF